MLGCGRQASCPLPTRELCFVSDHQSGRTVCKKSRQTYPSEDGLPTELVNTTLNTDPTDLVSGLRPFFSITSHLLRSRRRIKNFLSSTLRSWPPPRTATVRGGQWPSAHSAGHSLPSPLRCLKGLTDQTSTTASFNRSMHLGVCSNFTCFLFSKTMKIKYFHFYFS